MAADPAETAETAAAILALETELLRPETRLSPPRLAQLLADDFREITASGATCDKADCLATLQPLGPFTIDVFDCRMLSATLALATYRLTLNSADGPTPTHTLRRSLWRREAGAWRMTFHQGTPA